MTTHEAVVAEEREARQRHRNLEKARRVAAENRDREQRDQRRTRLRELRTQEDEAYRVYRAAFREARSARGPETDRLWNAADVAQSRAQGITAAIRRMERER